MTIRLSLTSLVCLSQRGRVGSATQVYIEQLAQYLVTKLNLLNTLASIDSTTIMLLKTTQVLINIGELVSI